MLWLWFPFAFFAGFLTSWYWGVALLSRLLNRPNTETTKRVVARMPHDRLLELTGLLHTEIMNRERGIEDA